MVAKTQLPSRQVDNVIASKEGATEAPMSMHDGIAIWCDCCVCEAEPYWAELAEELGVSLSNYEEGKAPK